MGLASALSTSLTGMNAAETTIDVVGNNLANSNTIGFKASSAAFATQFLLTQSLGSKPTTASAGTNPRQIGLGTLVGAITPDFTQGTIEISTDPLHMAIQNDGFFIVQGSGGEHLYTRNGIFSLNAENELTSISGNRVLGFGVDANYNIVKTQLEPLTINLGGDVVAEATQNVYLEGILPPDSTQIATDSQITQSPSLGTDEYTRPANQATQSLDEAPIPSNASFSGNITGAGAGGLADGTRYYYRITYGNYAQGGTPTIEWMDGTSQTTNPSETIASAISPDPFDISFVATAVDGSCDISLPAVPADYDFCRVYRTSAVNGLMQPVDFEYLDQVASAVPVVFTDTGAVTTNALQTQTPNLQGNYAYYVTFTEPGSTRESRPSDPITGSLTNYGSVVLADTPTPAPGSVWLDGTNYTMNIYRNTGSSQSTWYKVATLTDCDTANPPNFTDHMSDIQISVAGAEELDFNGPPITVSTLLIDIIRQTGNETNPTYERMFPVDATETGTLLYSPRKGGVTLATKELTIYPTTTPDHNATTVQDLIIFMQDATGIVYPGPDTDHPIPVDQVTGSSPGITIDTATGRIVVVSDPGEQNAVSIPLSAMSLEISGTTGSTTVLIPFMVSQSGNGIGTLTDFIAYDSLGTPIQVRLTFELEDVDNFRTTYRWYADSPDNQKLNNSPVISVGTGLIYFDDSGNFDSATNSIVNIERNHVPALPLSFELHFNNMTALASSTAEASVSSQDGSSPGTLTSFIVGEDGIIRGVYNNGVTRDLGQIQLARFANPQGLIQQGENLFTAGVNSGEPVTGNPGEFGIGSVVAGAVELSNTDIGANLIDLILASTMYRGNSRVITTTQEMFDELLNLTR